MNKPIYESAPKAFVIQNLIDKDHITYPIDSPEGVIIHKNTGLCKAFWTIKTIESSNKNLDLILTPGRKIAFVLKHYNEKEEIHILIGKIVVTAIDYNYYAPRKYCTFELDKEIPMDIVDEIVAAYSRSEKEEKKEKEKKEKKEKTNLSPWGSGLKKMPHIKKVIINDPAVVVFWSDDTKTIGKAMKGEIFNPEVGLAMAISRKYYESGGYPNPRAAFKRELEHANDISKKTKEKKSLKNRMKNKSIFGERTIERIREHLNATD